MRTIFSAIVICLIFASGAQATDNLFNSVTAIKEEARRLGDEALDVASAPVDTENYGLLGTVAAAGAVGLTYVFDADIRDKVQGKKGSTLDKAADAGSFIGNPFLHLGVAAAVYGGGVLADSPRYRETGEMLGEAAILADAATFVLKGAIGRGRPFVAGDKGSFRPFQLKTDYDSLPSMHAASSFAMASVLASTSESVAAKLLYYSAATFVGFSRLYQDKHWASDVVLGAVIGELCGRVVTNYHAGNGGRRVAITPMVSADALSLALVGRW